MLVKVRFRFVPIVRSATMTTTAMSAAMSPYSIAVAPLSQRRKRVVRWRARSNICHHGQRRSKARLIRPMIIKAIAAVTGARATDSGLTVVLEMLDGGEQPVRMLLPVSAIDQSVAFLRRAAEQAAELQAETGLRGDPAG